MVTLESLQENGAAEMDDSCSMSAYSVSDNDDGHVDSSEGSSSAAKHSRASENIETTIAKTETRAVARTRIFVAFILVVSMIAVAVLIYIFTSKGEQDKFEQKFEDDSTQILETIGSTLDVTLSSTDAFIANIMAYARYSNSTWPFVTKPEYAVEAAKLLVLSKAVYIGEYVFVEEEEKLAWQNYSVHHDSWVQEGIDLQRRNPDYKGIIIDEFQTLGLIHDNFAQERIGGPYMPTWQVAPVVPIYFPYNWDASTHERMGPTIKHIFEKQHVVIGAASGVADPNNPDQILQAEYDALWIKNYISEDDNPSEPFSEIYYPMIDAPGQVRIDVDQPQDIVGFSVITFFWRDLIRDILYEDSKGVVVVIENSCNQVWTYQIDGPNTTYLGPGDLHDSNFDGMRRSAPLYNLRELFSNSGVYTGIPLGEDYCVHTLHVYPSTEMRNEFITHGPIIYTVSAVAFFVLTLLAFLIYDWKVERRQKKVMATAVQTSKIVSSLFPSNVRDRLFQGRETGEHGLPFVGLEPQKRRLKSFLSSGSDKSAEAREVDVDRPIADLFPNCTVMFADISGFTAWSSVREPAQVFRLLETLYGAFDEIANKRRVFKVETIGDSYVAVTGLPEPRKDHAVVMARYAFDCRSKMAELTKQLETTLGPDTGDLQFRFGLNSGPVTAGVLRGEKTRFQLFGDTVNTAARMESSGARSKIQCSQTTADSLVEAGKEHWLKARSELVEAKGKGRMQTFWIEPREHQASHVSSAPSAEVAALFDEKTQRLVDWNTDVLARLIRQVVARRNVSIKGKKKSFKPSVSKIEFQCDLSKSNGTALDEVREIIELPEFDHSLASKQEDPDSINLGQDILGELREYIVNIASMYHNNPFHNFEHASHVTMSVVKLLSRIVAPDEVYSDAGVKDSHKLASSLHDHTYGITSDPLTQFACVFSALIHDVDHSGVPNAQLVKERTHIASFYKGKSVAEQNSVDIAWDLLMSDSFQKLRTKIASNPDELRRFRQLVVNSVMATDIMDKDLGAARKARWNKAFAQGSERAKEDTVATNSRDDINRKATIVIEHLIQASDVSHTMQHWHIYRKWNERFFIECYQAYTSGRAEANPVDNWYKGEMGFFDFYIIPLAKKLSECGVFGVSSDEYLNYAVRNRQEWEERGQEVVASMIEKVERREASQEVDCEGRREKAPLHNRGDDMTRMMHHLTRSSG